MREFPLSLALYVDFGGGPRPLRVHRKPPRRGAREIVPVERTAFDGAEVHVVFRPGSRPVAIGAGSRAWAEATRAQLTDGYEIAAVPVIAA